jgi:signal transduction histidine kinase
METRFPDLDKAIPNGKPFLEIIFTDNGIGIPEENLPKIFDPFFSTKEGTLGLGLAIVHNIIDMHKGAIHVDSGNGGGTVFSLLLPLMDPKNDPMPKY